MIAIRVMIHQMYNNCPFCYCRKSPNEIDILRSRYENLKKEAERDIFKKLERIQNSFNSIKDVQQKYNKLQAEIQTARDKNTKIQIQINSVNKQFIDYEDSKSKFSQNGNFFIIFRIDYKNLLTFLLNL